MVTMWWTNVLPRAARGKHCALLRPGLWPLPRRRRGQRAATDDGMAKGDWVRWRQGE